jgi:peptide-methionine (S)-S-oxide reductase
MSPRTSVALIVSVFAVAFALAAAAAGAAGGTKPSAVPASSSNAPAPAARDTAFFAGGCFWCMETAFEGRPGIVAVVSGYSGGKTANPSYEEVSAHGTGHLETVAVVYDPAKTSYRALLELFWYSIDPTQSNGQFCDRGDSYFSAIFVRNAGERKAAEASKRTIEQTAALSGRPIVTKILDAAPFYLAEDYHQDFYKKNPLRYQAYRAACGRDARLKELWGEKAVKPIVH